MIGDFVDAVVRDIADRNPASPGRFEVHVVDPNAVADDYLRPLHAGDHVGIDRCKLSDDSIRIRHQCRQLSGGLPLFQGGDFVPQRPENALFDFETRKRVVSDGDFHVGISAENSTQAERHTLDKVRLSDNLIIGLVVCQLPAVNSVRKLMPETIERSKLRDVVADRG